MSADRRTFDCNHGLPAGSAFRPFEDERLRRPILEGFEAIAAEEPDRLAAVSGVERIDYGALDLWASAIARSLLERVTAARVGKGEPTIVAILSEHGLCRLAAALGAMKAGLVQCVLDPDYSDRNLVDLLQHSRAAIVLSDARHLERSQTLGRDAGCQVTNAEALRTESTVSFPSQARDPEALIMVAYTSGSTGNPKCVMGRSVDVLCLAHSLTNVMKIDRNDRILVMRGLWSSQVYAGLLNGASLYFFDLKRQGFGELARWIARNEVTLCGTFPTAVRRLADVAAGTADLHSLRVLYFLGEPISGADIVRFRAAVAPSCTLVNCYATTEQPLISFYPIDSRQDWPPAAILPAGRPFPNFDVTLLDAEGKKVPPGEVGAVTMSGRHIVPGYLRAEELNARTFFTDPQDPAQRCYRTGDLGYLDEAGQLVIGGRLDEQVKVRGHRLLLGDVDAALKEHESVRDAAVRFVEKPNGGGALAAFVVLQPGEPFDAAALRRFLAEQLPDYMVPLTIEALAGLPMTATGKVNRRALPEPSQPCERALYEHPNDAVEVHLKHIWEDLLGIEGIGLSDDFFDLGGDSLMALELSFAIDSFFGKQLPLDALWFEGARLCDLARALRSLGEQPPWQGAVLMKKGREGELPLFAVHTIGGHLMDYMHLLRHLPAEQPVWGLQARGLDGKAPPDTSIEAMAAQTLAAMRSVQPEGPYRIMGYSSGGLIGLEMARSLVAEGEAVWPLILIDSALPGFGTRDVLEMGGNLLHPSRWRGFQERFYFLALTALGLQHRRRLRRVGESHRWAYWSYRPHACEVDAVLLRAADGVLAEKLESDWRSLLGPRLSIEDLPGDHYSLLREPGVERLARAIERLIVREDTRTPSARWTQRAGA